MSVDEYAKKWLRNYAFDEKDEVWVRNVSWLLIDFGNDLIHNTELQEKVLNKDIS